MEKVTFIHKKPGTITISPARVEICQGQMIPVHGERIVFSKEGVFETSDEKIIKILREKKYYGTDLVELNDGDFPEKLNPSASALPVSGIFVCKKCKSPFVDKETYDLHTSKCINKE